MAQPIIPWIGGKRRLADRITTDIRYTVGGGGAGVDRSEVLIFSWDVQAEPAGLF